MESPNATMSGAGMGAGAIRVVVQRCESVELLLDNVALWAEMGRGLIAYIGCVCVCAPRPRE